jgi:hypothetical protein
MRIAISPICSELPESRMTTPVEVVTKMTLDIMPRFSGVGKPIRRKDEPDMLRQLHRANVRNWRAFDKILRLLRQQLHLRPEQGSRDTGTEKTAARQRHGLHATYPGLGRPPVIFGAFNWRGATLPPLRLQPLL